MRHQYTPIFRDLLDSSLWASATPATRCVWITFLLDADPEGYIPMSVPGLARRANVTLQAARAAIEMLEAPDPDSRTPDFEGRRIAKVPGGWRVLNFVAKRELAKHEAEKARKRKWANANGKRPANDNDGSAKVLTECAESPNVITERSPSSHHGDSASVSMRLALDAPSETLDAPKPKPLPKPKPEDEEEIVRHHILKEVPEGYQPSEALRMAAKLAGVKDLDHWIGKLRMKPIGGQSGILAHKLDEWLIGLVPEWRKWEETNAFKDANSRAAAASGRSFQSPGAPVGGPARERVQGAPDWVYREHDAFARSKGLDLNRAAKAYAKQSGFETTPANMFAPFMKYLENLAAQKASA